MAQNVEKGITIVFRGNTASFDDSIGNIEKALKVVQADTKELNKELKLDPYNVDKMTEKMKNLTAQLELAKKEQGYYRKAVLDSIEPSKKVTESERYKKLVVEIRTAEQTVEAMQIQLKKAADAQMDVLNPKEWEKQNNEYKKATENLDKLNDEMYELATSDYTVKNGDMGKYYNSMRQERQTGGYIASIEMQTKKLQDAMESVDALNFANKLNTIGTKAKTIGEGFKKAADATKYFSAVATAALAGAVKEAAEFQQQMVAIKKVVEPTENTSYTDLENQIKQMAKTVPVNMKTIMETYANAGQLGVATDNLSEFVETMLRLDSATNLTANDAAMTIAQLYNVMGSNIDSVDNFANALVRLGNNSATTEKDILEMAATIGASAKQVGFTEYQVLGLADALSSAGLNPSSAGTAIAKTLTTIDKALAKGTSSWYKYSNTQKKYVLTSTGSLIKEYARLLGINEKTDKQTLATFRRMWEENPAEVFRDIVGGMSEAVEEGENLNTIFEKLGINGAKQDSTIKALANSYPLLKDAMSMSKKAFEEGNDAVDESDKAWDTFVGKIQTLKNNLQILAMELGDVLLPPLMKITEKVTEWVRKWQSMSNGTKTFIVVVLGVIAVLAPLLMLLANVFNTFGSLILIYSKLITMFPKLASAFKAIFSPKSLIIAGILLLIGLIITYREEIAAWWEEFKNSEAWAKIKQFFIDVGNWFSGLWSVIEGFWNKITGFFGWLGEKIQNALSGFKELIGVDTDAIGTGRAPSGNKAPRGKNDIMSPLHTMYSGGLGIPMRMATGGTTLTLSTSINVTNNGTPIDEATIRRWGNTITDVVSDNLGKRW